MLRGMMMDTPLNVSAAIDYGAEMHPDARIVSATIEGGIHRTTYAETAPRVAQLAHALKALGVREGDRIATLAWNGYRHFELYYAVGGIGAVCHTINPRLFPEQLVYIVNHAKDRVLFFDINLAPLVAKMRAHWPKDLVYVAMCDRAHLPTGEGLEGVLAYEDLLAGSRPPSPGRASTRTRRSRSATPPAPPASRRARSIRSARSCCTRCSR